MYLQRSKGQTKTDMNAQATPEMIEAISIFTVVFEKVKNHAGYKGINLNPHANRLESIIVPKIVGMSLEQATPIVKAGIRGNMRFHGIDLTEYTK